MIFKVKSKAKYKSMHTIHNWLPGPKTVTLRSHMLQMFRLEGRQADYDERG